MVGLEESSRDCFTALGVSPDTVRLSTRRLIIGALLHLFSTPVVPFSSNGGNGGSGSTSIRDAMSRLGIIDIQILYNVYPVFGIQVHVLVYTAGLYH